MRAAEKITEAFRKKGAFFKLRRTQSEMNSNCIAVNNRLKGQRELGMRNLETVLTTVRNNRLNQAKELLIGQRTTVATSSVEDAVNGRTKENRRGLILKEIDMHSENIVNRLKRQRRLGMKNLETVLTTVRNNRLNQAKEMLIEQRTTVATSSVEDAVTRNSKEVLLIE